MVKHINGKFITEDKDSFLHDIIQMYGFVIPENTAMSFKEFAEEIQKSFSMENPCSRMIVKYLQWKQVANF